jgi:hypothetical protein
VVLACVGILVERTMNWKEFNDYFFAITVEVIVIGLALFLLGWAIYSLPGPQ